MRHFLILATAFALTGSAVPAQEASPHPDTNGFFEDFTGKLNKDRWYVSDGWSNGDWQDCVWSGRAVQVRGGAFVLLHSAAAARHFAAECERLAIDRSGVSLAALSSSV